MSDISLDPEAAAASVARWNAYADAIDQHGQVQHVPIEELQTMVGDIYSPYVTAKAAEYEARTAAYQRVADKARAHAAKLDNTRRTFEQTDEDSGQRIEQAGTMGTTTTPTPPPVPSAGDPPLDVFKAAAD
jgi:Excreted virulence factor EspC, type VII ESX diderm